MKKILLHYPKWKNRWEPYILEALKDFNITVTHETEVQKLGEISEKHDVLISMWANQIVTFWSHNFPDKKIVTYLRRFELWQQEYMSQTLWGNVDKVLYVSEWCRQAANMMWREHNVPRPKDQIVIPNGINFSQFSLREEKPKTKKIALVCSMREVKNLPLAYQILLELPEEYKLYHIGIPFTSVNLGTLFSYMHGLGLTDRYIEQGFIPKEKIPEWLQDKDYILSTSLNEGNPNNIIEAMALGVKPIIHNWPGAKDQFPTDLVFNKIYEAVGLITEEKYEPERYRDWVLKRYSLDNFEKFRGVVKEIACQI